MKREKEKAINAPIYLSLSLFIYGNSITEVNIKMKNKNVTQQENVLRHLYTYGSITKSYALAVFNIQNLMEVIRQLRLKGFHIITDYFVQQNGVKIVVYHAHRKDL